VSAAKALCFPAVRLFVRTDLVTTISHERLELSWWNLQLFLQVIFTVPYWWPDRSNVTAGCRCKTLWTPYLLNYTWAMLMKLSENNHQSLMMTWLDCGGQGHSRPSRWRRYPVSTSMVGRRCPSWSLSFMPSFMILVSRYRKTQIFSSVSVSLKLKPHFCAVWISHRSTHCRTVRPASFICLHLSTAFDCVDHALLLGVEGAGLVLWVSKSPRCFCWVLPCNTMLARYTLSYVRLSVTRRCFTKTSKCRITQQCHMIAHGLIVCWCKIPTGSPQRACLIEVG